MHNRFAGILTEDETGYTFTYDSSFLPTDMKKAYKKLIIKRVIAIR